MLITELKAKEVLASQVSGKVFIINCHGCKEVYFPEAAAEEFQKELNAALNSYQYYGKHDSKNGKVDVYVEVPENGYVRELVVYNPAIYTLNSLHGRFTVKSLLELSKEKN